MHENPGSTLNTATGATVLALLNIGELDVAEQQARSLVENAPEDRHAQYVLGLVHLMKGDAAASLPWLEKAAASYPENAIYRCNLGVACLRAGELDAAITHLDAALKQKPDYEEARYNLGCALLETSQAEAAQIQFAAVADERPENAAYICALGDAARALGEWNKAGRLYRDALAIRPDTIRAHINLAPMLMHAGRIDDAIAHCRQAIELDAAQVIAYKNLGDCLVRQEAFEEAMDAYADAYDIDADSAVLCVAIGKLWLETGDTGEASSWFQKALHSDADNIDALCCLANIVRESGDLASALEMLEPLLDSDPDNAEVLKSMADILWEDGDADGALDLLRRAQRLQPERISLHGRIGQILSSSGDVEQAVKEYQTALDRNPACIPALNGLATTQRGKLGIACAEQMRKMTSGSRHRSGALASLHGGLAYYYDGCKDHESAAMHMELANSNQWDSRSMRGWEYEPANYEKHITRLMETFSTDYFERVKAFGNSDHTPVFIVGMPRSGTTLTEQILARHTKVLGIGERNFAAQSFNKFNNAGRDDESENFSRLDEINAKPVTGITAKYLDRLRQLKDKAGLPDADRVVDKMPDNFSLLGWIVTLFPNAKIIHCRRDPRDVALSCWMTQFGSIRWACHKEHLAGRIKQYQRIMDHWRRVIPEKFIELDYENLVANQETESRRLIEWIGLDWEDACLSFYESDRLIRTASITQVRQPIYTRSVARWKAYEPYLHELFDPLSIDTVKQGSGRAYDDIKCDALRDGE